VPDLCYGITIVLHIEGAMYKLIIVTYALTLAISLLVIDGYEIAVTCVNYIFFLGLCALNKSRQREEERANISMTSLRSSKEERNFAAMSH
jgi:hypothetical protein